MASSKHTLWDLDVVDNATHCRQSQRSLDVFCCGIHLGFLLLLCSVLILFGYFSRLRSYSSNTLLPYPGHKRKWLFSILLILVLLCDVGEGILTDLTTNHETKPHLYVPQLCALLSGLISLVYYNYLEYWNRPHLTWLLVLYWPFAIATDVVRLIKQTDEVGFDPSIMRLYIVVSCVLIYTCLLFLECNVVRTKIFHCWYTEKGFPAGLKKKRLFFHYKYNSLFQRMIFNKMNRLFALGYQRPLEISDLGCVPEDLECKNVYKELNVAYSAEQARATKKNRVPSLWRAYLKAFGRNIFVGVFVRGLGNACSITFPLSIGGIITYASVQYYDEVKFQTVENDCYVTVNEFFTNGFVLTACLFVAAIGRIVFVQYGNFIVDFVSLQASTAIQAYTYEKSLHLPVSALSSGDMTVGQVTNHMSVDAMAIFHSTQTQAGIWTVPFHVVAILALLYMEIGVSALIGATFYIVFLLVQLKVAGRLAGIQTEVLKTSDKRLKKINETLRSMNLVKLCGWEEVFCNGMDIVRNKQVHLLIKVGIYTGVMISLSIVTSAIVSLIAIVSYSFLTHDPLTPDVAFVALAFFSELHLPLAIFANGIHDFANAIPSFRRLQLFFDYKESGRRERMQPTQSRGFQDFESDGEDSGDEGDMMSAGSSTTRASVHNDSKLVKLLSKSRKATDKYRSIESGSHVDSNTFQEKSSFITEDRESSVPENVAFQISGGTFSWNSDGSSPTLSNINLNVLNGSFVIVIGLVGSGKSSLLSAILGEMTTVSGTVRFERERKRVAYVPQKAWLQNATLRDNIIFGQAFDQKRYDAVIEACALQPDINILPAGDITEIGERGINLSGGQKQRVSVARAIYSNIDIVILDDPLSALDVHVSSHLLENGIMDLLVRQGKTVMLVTHQLQSLQFAHKVVLMDDGKIVREGDPKEVQKHEPELFAAWERTSRNPLESDGHTGKEDDRVLVAEEEVITSKENKERVLGKDSFGKLIEEEERCTGSVSWRIYRTYARAIKYSLAALTLLLLTAQSSTLMACNFWLSAWSGAGLEIRNNTQENIEEESVYYRRGYIVLTLTFVVLLVAYVFGHIITSIFAAKRMHFALLQNLVSAPIRFFDTTPVGRILNRFSNDTQVIDQTIWETTLDFLQTTWLCLFVLIVNTIVTPVFIVVAAPFLIVYYFIKKYYVATSRELQRLDSITKSPTLAHFSETLGGLSSIRAYGDENRFRKRLLETKDTNNVSRLYYLCGYRWLAIRLGFIGAFIILISALTSLISCTVGAIPPSLVGLALTYAISLCGQLNWVVRIFAECEMNMNAVERVEHYTRIKTEEYRGTYTPRPSWPDKGNIKFEDVSVRYSNELEPVLEDVSVHFKAGEKIGICGRTGSGKSSLTLALFRMIDTYKGRIVIDDVDISRVPLLTLRTRLSIIPQDPMLFSGTIRFNLDPERTKGDVELWNALEIAQLKEIVAELPYQLDADVIEAGENFSVGQRQLFCLARAFLRNAKILIMDEATASIDVKTDTIIQQVLSTVFADKTVLTIAHRMSTILDSDNVLVLSEGRVVEFGSPEKLKNQEGSMFSALVKGHY
ncbi:ATP-binding cassette sub-family C member 8-like isoform X2 [Ptychodera flava]|uniref:ATP-binding cassette sub-family C member 8-like isoform X2 n=1 Tax=Ptychodera flava TaxID=63121 RepID=UPI00396A40DB